MMMSISTHKIVITILLAWAGGAELEYSGKIQIHKRSELFLNLQSFVMERSTTYVQFISSIDLHCHNRYVFYPVKM